jgi:Protein of unknown function (DUF4230)
MFFFILSLHNYKPFMNKLFNFFKKINFAPYIIVVVLTLIIGWFLFRQKTLDTEITVNNDLAITKIQAIGKMELVKLTIKDVVEYNIKRDYLPDSKVLLVIAGEMAGCIDLTKIKTNQIINTDSVIEITLPNPEVCYYKIDHQKSKIYNATTYYLLDNELELTQKVYKMADAYFASDSLTRIVKHETELNAEKILKPLLESITHKQVLLYFDKKAIKP